MAGLVDGFNPTEFRTEIRKAMIMGLAPDEANQPIFVFPREAVNATSADNEDIPFDPNARPQMAPPASLRKPCAVEYVDAAGRVETFGTINPSKIRITVLDEDYEEIKGFSHVMIAGDRYNYAKTEPAFGLGEVGVWTIHCLAEDES